LQDGSALGYSSSITSGKFRHQSALDTQTLSLNYNEVEYIELDEVMRQEEDSGILHNATELRELKILLSLIFSLTLRSLKTSFG
jgi:hypothetical protein